MKKPSPTLAAAAAAVVMSISLAPEGAFASLPNLTESAALTSATAVPGSTVRASGTFTPTADLGSIVVTVDLLGTGGAGSFTLVSVTSGLTGCVLDGSGRQVACNFNGATAASGAQQIVVDINVGAGATIGGVWTFETGSGQTLSGNGQTLSIVAPATTTTTTVAPTTVVPTTVAPTTVAPTTTVIAAGTTVVGGSGGGLPSVGFDGRAAEAAAMLVAAGALAIGVSRRRVTR